VHESAKAAEKQKSTREISGAPPAEQLNRYLQVILFEQR
jgi:hypothetical protein